MQLDFDGGSERIVAEELLRVRTHRLSLLAACLLGSPLVADTLYQQALKLGDKKAQCLEMCIRDR